MSKLEHNMPKPEYQGEGEVYLVGGAVRDDLLGRDVGERDWVVTGATAADLEAAGFLQVGKKFPVFIARKSGEEYALARTETKTGSKHTDFICDFGPEVTLEEDLVRRDLTINTLARSADGELIDQHGGFDDLKQRKLRHVSSAFAEDPLRVLRVGRFMAELALWDFSLDSETESLLKTMVAGGELQDLTPERVWGEMKRALATPAAARFFETLDTVGALSVIWHNLKTPWAGGLGAKALADTRLSDMAAANRYALVAVAGLDPELSLDEWVIQLSRWQRQLRIPNDFQRLAAKLARLHALEAGAVAFTVADMFRRIDIYRQPEDLDRLLTLTTVLADAQGRQGWNADRIRAMAKTSMAVDAQPFREKGFDGLELSVEIEEARVKGMEEVLKSWSE